MRFDITLRITPAMLKDAQGNDNKDLTGHLGTHFDVMNKEFPLEYTERRAVVFDVSFVNGRDIDVCDVDLEKVTSGMFVAFYTGFIESEQYGTQRYFKEHPQLSDELIERLLGKNISVIGVDFAGIRRGKEHTPKDLYCADRGVFVVENLCNLKTVIDTEGELVIHTYPMRFEGISGLPCRVIAEA